MNPAIAPPVRQVLESVSYRPSVSIVMPFEPKMNAKADLAYRLKLAVDKVEREIRAGYDDELAILVLQKLRSIIKNLNFNTFKKSIAIFVSPVFEKVIYLDIVLQENIIVNGSFSIKDILSAKEELHKYLLLIVSGKSSKVYLGNSSTFIKVKSNVPDHIAAFRHDIHEKVANFADSDQRKETLLKKFLHATDEGLKLLLQAYPLPVFILAPKKVIGYFKSLTKHEKNIVGYIHGNYEESSEAQIKEALNPYLINWKSIKLHDLQQQMERAADSGKLASGLRDVWKQATQHKGRLLIIEKKFISPNKEVNNDQVIYMPNSTYTRYSCTRDIIDDIIEKVLENGGDVEFVDEGLLNEHNKICLIQYY
jgi:hypothetical protein